MAGGARRAHAGVKWARNWRPGTRSGWGAVSNRMIRAARRETAVFKTIRDIAGVFYARAPCASASRRKSLAISRDGIPAHAPWAAGRPGEKSASAVGTLIWGRARRRRSPATRPGFQGRRCAHACARAGPGRAAGARAGGRRVESVETERFTLRWVDQRGTHSIAAQRPLRLRAFSLSSGSCTIVSPFKSGCAAQPAVWSQACVHH